MITFILCVLIADFITGLVHWFEDTYITPSWPILGKYVGEPNILHHQKPGFIGTMTTLLSRNYQTVVPAIIVIAISTMTFGFWWPLVFTLALASFGNEVHAWNHRKKNNWIVSLLQDMCIIQTKNQHRIHHIPPYDTAYCTITNLLNPILDRLNFWRILEYIILKTLRVKVKRCSPERSGF